MTIPPSFEDIEQLQETLAWRLRLLDTDPADRTSSSAVRQLELLVADLQARDHDPAALELMALLNWLSESGAIADYRELTCAYRARIGESEFPPDGATYLRALLRIAQSLI